MNNNQSTCRTQRQETVVMPSLVEKQKRLLVEWLKVRDAYLDAAVAKSHIYKKNPDDSRIFPFDPTTAY